MRVDAFFAAGEKLSRAAAAGAPEPRNLCQNLTFDAAVLACMGTIFYVRVTRGSQWYQLDSAVDP